MQAAENLAENIKYQRQKRNLSQGQLAKLSEVPRSTIANIETGMSNPTLSVMSKISSALKLSIEELLSAAKIINKLYKAGTLPVLKVGDSQKVTIQKLFPHAIPGMEIDRLSLKSGARMKGNPHRPGTFEYLYCESGSIDLWVSGEKMELKEGDLATFSGDQHHSYTNPYDNSANAFSVVVLAPIDL